MLMTTVECLNEIFHHVQSSRTDAGILLGHAHDGFTKSIISSTNELINDVRALERELVYARDFGERNSQER